MMGRGVRVTAAQGVTARFISPEDVILKKLDYYRESGSEKHVRDVLGVLKVPATPVDRTYIAEWADRLGLSDQWRYVLEREAESPRA